MDETWKDEIWSQGRAMRHNAEGKTDRPKGGNGLERTHGATLTKGVNRQSIRRESIYD